MDKGAVTPDDSAPAVAENQPVQTKNRVKTDQLNSLPEFAATLRRLIRAIPTGSLRDLPPLPEFDELARGLFHRQFAHNLPYQTFCRSRNVTPETVQAWQQIPAVPALAFKEFELTSLPPAARTRVFHSSGTTGQRPSRHFHSADSLATYEASLLPWFAAHLNPAAEHLEFLFLTPAATAVPHSSLAHMFESIRRESGAPESAFAGSVENDGSWNLDFEKILAALQTAVGNLQPLILLGTAFNFVHLLDQLAARDLRFHLPAGSRVLETGGYKGRSRALPKNELHALITEWLGIPAGRIVCEYGMSELSSQAYDGAAGKVSAEERTFRFPPWARAQIISPETGREVAEGETGLIRIFDLANVYSVMAIQTEDLGIRRGAGFAWAGRATLAEPRGCSVMSAMIL